MIDKEEYPYRTFFFKYDECYFGYNQKNGNFWYDYDKVWSIFETKYNMNFQQIQVFIKGMVNISN